MPSVKKMENIRHTRTIIHLDMDAFYPAVEVLDNPELLGKPVIVGGSKGRGVVSSASYEARVYGIHSAQPMAQAVRLCPHAIILPVRMSRYKEISRQVFRIFKRYTPLVEPLSIDEAFLDITGTERLFGPPVTLAKRIKTTVRTETGLTVSAGIAPSKFVAKIASDLEKPDGLTVVAPDRITEFLDPLPIGKMWGVGTVTQQAFARLGIHTFRDLRSCSAKTLETHFGKHGMKMHRLAMGIDEREVETEHEIKSIGHEQTFEHDIIDRKTAHRELLSLALRVAHRMRGSCATGRTVSLKVKYHDFVQITRAITLKHNSDDGSEIYRTVCELMGKTDIGKKPVRLLGISVSQLSFTGIGEQVTIFHRANTSQKRKNLNKALDSLQEKFGEKSIRLGTLLDTTE